MAMKLSSLVLVAVFVFTAAVTTMNTQVEGLITCRQVATNLSECVYYLKGKAALSTACCNRVKSLNNAARTKADRQAVCKCLKLSASTAKEINYGLAGSLPRKCGLNIPYKISPSTDCNKIN